MKRLRSVFVLSLMLNVGMSWVIAYSKLAAQTLPLPDQLTPLTSPEGQQLLQDSESQGVVHREVTLLMRSGDLVFAIA